MKASEHPRTRGDQLVSGAGCLCGNKYRQILNITQTENKKKYG